VAEDDLLGVDVLQLCSGPKALADVVEALIAAVFLDSNGTITCLSLADASPHVTCWFTRSRRLWTC
jgi:dsRNA-specific ribonuclease